ncbi:hypothetical protein GQ55_2G379200 [Panicum hallii var. hallii]|uniref:AAA+ ATPase domain-containing protein n=1 Tax=Panicum hallii var. hallii TaxID=1504633 RepID=A0A2T7EWP1_9POAL|nr:hypothetical protein GQ55_2G379200 [Panicum hallii var. hallii]
MDLSTVMASPSYAKAADAYKKAVATAATVTTYTVLARGMARELVPDELRSAARWAVSAVRDRSMPPPKPRSFRTILIGRENRLFWDARAYLATLIDPTAMSRLCLTFRDDRQMLSMLPGDSVTDVFEGVEFTWTLIAAQSGPPCTLALSFDAEKTEVALHRYVPFIVMQTEGARRRERSLKIFMNELYSWKGINHQHPATFDTVAMDPALKQSIIADLDRFLKRRDYYRRIGKAWKRGYLLYGSPATGKSSVVAAIANYLRFNLYDLDLSRVSSNKGLQKLLTALPNKSILVIEDIDCCFSTAAPREGSASVSERIIVFTTNYKDRLDPALLRPGLMDMQICMGYCGWDAFKTLARNYFLVDGHELFPEMKELLSAVEVTPAEATEMLLRSEDVDVALQGFVEFLQDTKKQGRRRSKK